MFIQGNQRTQAVGREFIQQQGRAGLITAIATVTRQGVGILYRRITECQQPRLGQTVRQCQLVLGPQFGHGKAMLGLAVAPCRHDKVAGDRLGPLVQQLIERMLRVRADGAPDNRAGGVIHRVAGQIDRLAVGLHLQLLKVVGQLLEASVVGQYRVGVDAQHVGVPDPDQPQQHRQIVGPGRLTEMLVHRMRTGQQLTKTRHADRQRNRQANGRPQRKPPANPLPQRQLIGRGNPPLGHALGRRRHADKVAGQEPRQLAQLALQPAAGGGRIAQGIDGGERLGRNDKQRRMRVQATQQLRHLAAVHGRGKVHPQR